MYKVEAVWVVILTTKNEIIDLRAFTNYDLAKAYHDSIKELPKNSMLSLEEVPINSSKKYKQVIF